MSTLAELSIFPMDKGESVSPWVARVLDRVRESGLDYELNPMGTCIEGDWEPVMKTVDVCMRELQKDCSRIYMTLKVDFRRGRVDALTSKRQSLEEKMSRPATG